MAKKLSTTVVDTAPLVRHAAKLGSLTKIDFVPLMIGWGNILDEENEEGVMAGLDGFGHLMEPVTYRPKPGKKVDRRILRNDNLTRSWYRSLDGPPLAPRGLDSRVIKNFATDIGHDKQEGDWFALGYWEDVLNPQGVPILPWHFQGMGDLPVRNLAHVRPSALERARQALRDFVAHHLRQIRSKGNAD